YALAVAALTAATLAATPQRRAVALRIPAVIVAYHVAYGLGSIAGAWDVLRQRPGRERFSGLTR
ncbi:MAG: glycosyltransferase family 2 protein, partial [Caldimonas sp.]